MSPAASITGKGQLSLAAAVRAVGLGDEGDDFNQKKVVGQNDRKRDRAKCRLLVPRQLW